MNKNIVIVGGIGIVIVCVFGLFLFRNMQTRQVGNGEPTTFSTSSTNSVGTGTTNQNPVSERLTLETSSGGVDVQNFMNNPATVADPYNAGYYYLGYHNSFDGSVSTTNPPYIIGYIAATQYFNIVLNTEPIADSRTQAEQYLMNALGITKEQMCTLHYMVSVPGFVNEYYSSRSLGFSFCPGSVPL